MSDNVIKPDDYINLEMTKLFKALLYEYINKEIGVEITLENYNKLSEEEKASGNYFIKDAGPVNEFTQIFDTISEIESNEEAYKYVGALAIKELLANIILKTDTVDNLESTETKLPLSANMGRKLNKLYKGLIHRKSVQVYANIAANAVYTHTITLTEDEQEYGTYVFAVPYGTSTGSGMALPILCYKNGDAVILHLYNPSNTAIASSVRQGYMLWFFKI